MRKSRWRQKRRTLLNACLAIIGTLAALTGERADAALITGTVRSEGAAVDEAHIWLELEKGQLNDTTSAEGRFLLEAVPVGRHLVVISRLGYQTLTQTVEIAAEDTIWLDLILQKLPAVLPPTVITGTRSPRMRDDSPIYTTLVSKEEMADRGALRLDDILSEQTGLNVISDHGAGVQIQGFDSDYTLVLLDGEPVIGRTAGTLDLQRFAVGNLEQLEIVKGPTSSLYGSDALAGVVNLITRQPHLPLQARLQSRYASRNSADVAGELEFRRGRVGLLLFSSLNRSDGYDLDPTTIAPTTPEFTDLTLHPKLTYRLNDRTDLRIGLRFNQETQRSLDTAVDDDVQLVVEDDDETREVSLSTQLEFRPRTTFKTLLKLYGARFSTVGQMRSQDSGRQIQRSDFAQIYCKGETQFDAVVWQKHLLTFGGGYIREGVEADRIATGEQSSSSLFVFAQDEWNAHPAVDLVLSARTDAHSDYATHLSPKVAALARPTPWLSLRASVGKGFKAPAFRQLYLDFTNATVGYSVFGTTTVANSLEQLRNGGQIQRELLAPPSEKIEPETSVAYNLGLDLRPRADLRLRVNLFRNNLENLIDTAPIAVKTNDQRVFTYFNVDRVFTQGLESEVELALGKQLDLGLGYQLVEVKDEAVSDQIKAGTLFARDVVGRSRRVRASDYGGLFNRSRHSGVIWATYRDENRGVGVTVRGILRGRSGYADINSNGILDHDDEYTPGYALWNLTASKQLGAFGVQIGANNLLDKTNPERIPSLSGRTVYAGLGRDF